MSDRERQRIRERQVRITPCDQARASAETYWCEALNSQGRCSVYEIRPMICRLWGVIESMRCPFGCKPEGGYLSDEQGAELLLEAMAAGGHHIVSPAKVEEWRAAWRAEPGLRARWRQTARAATPRSLREYTASLQLPDEVKSRKDKRK